MFSVCFGSVYVCVRALLCRCVRLVYVLKCVYLCECVCECVCVRALLCRCVYVLGVFMCVRACDLPSVTAGLRDGRCSHRWRVQLHLYANPIWCAEDPFQGQLLLAFERANLSIVPEFLINSLHCTRTTNAWRPENRLNLHLRARFFQLKPLTVISYLFSLHTHHPMRGCPETGTVCARYPLGGSSQVSWCLRSTCANDACIEKISRARTFWQLKKAHLQFFYALKAPVQIIRATEVLFRLHREMHRALSLLPRNKKNVSKL